MKESLRHQEAFDFYYSLGNKRNLSEVAERFDISTTSTKKWSKAFSWQERVKERDMNNASKIEKITNRTIVQEKAKYIEQIETFISKAMEDFECGKLRCKSISDFEKLIKLQLLLFGDPTEINQITREEINSLINHVVMTIEKYVKDEEALRMIAEDFKQGQNKAENGG